MRNKGRFEAEQRLITKPYANLKRGEKVLKLVGIMEARLRRNVSPNSERYTEIHAKFIYYNYLD